MPPPSRTSVHFSDVQLLDGRFRLSPAGAANRVPQLFLDLEITDQIWRTTARSGFWVLGVCSALKAEGGVRVAARTLRSPMRSMKRPGPTARLGSPDAADQHQGWPGLRPGLPARTPDHRPDPGPAPDGLDSPDLTRRDRGSGLGRNSEVGAGRAVECRLAKRLRRKSFQLIRNGHLCLQSPFAGSTESQRERVIHRNGFCPGRGQRPMLCPSPARVRAQRRTESNERDLRDADRQCHRRPQAVHVRRRVAGHLHAGGRRPPGPRPPVADLA